MSRLRNALVVFMGAVLFMAVLAPTAKANTPVSLPFAVNFQDQGAATPSGYVSDYGQAYDPDRGYGWTNSNGVPTSLVGNGRDRNATADQRLDTLMQPQLKAGSPGVSTSGEWKAAIANGTYSVTVAAGDASYFDSTHVLRVEESVALNFSPSPATPFQTATVTVAVTDGFLDVDAIGGVNTKINYLTVSPLDASAPVITNVVPANNATDVALDAVVSITATEALDPSTLAAGFKVFDSNNAEVAGARNSNESTASFVANASFATNTTYRVATNADLKTVSGQTVQSNETTFTTAGQTSPPPGEGSEVVRVNFGTATTAAPAGYSPDFGQAYSGARGYGWETVAGQPVDLSQNGRQRNAVSDPRLDSFVHMDFNGPTGGVATEGRWQLDVPNGTYNLTVGLGDPSYTDSNNVLRAEGNVVASFVPTSSEPTKVFTATVAISDGKLTLDQVGGTNTKLSYIDVVGEGISEPPPVPGETTANVNFQTENAATPAGYSSDFGQPFDNGRGYGWEARSTGAPVNLVGNGRERNVASDQRVDTFMHMAFGGPSAGDRTESQWSINVPNGTYDLVVGVGDLSYFDSTHVVRAENQQLGSFAPSAANPTATFNGTVEVSDGKLTLDQGNGNNTKVTYIDIAPSDGTPPPPVDVTAPEVQIDVTGDSNASGQFIGSATVAVSATDNGGSGVAGVVYSLDGAGEQSFSQPFVVDTPGQHTVVARATDNAGNVSDDVTETFEIVVVESGPSVITATSPQDFLGLGSRLVFSTVNYNTQPTQSLQLTNPSGAAVQVTGFQFGGTNSGAFRLAPGQASSFSIAPGATANVNVQFTPVKHESNQATMAIQTSEPGAEPKVVTLGGMNAVNFEDVNEPSLQAIFDTFGYGLDAAVQFESTNFISKSSGPVGDEIIAPYFVRANASQPVNLHPLANYSGRSTFAKGPFGFNNKNAGSSANNGYFLPGGSDVFGGENQKLLPQIASGNTISWNDPSSVFGFRDGNSGAVLYSDDKLNGSAQLHNVRIYPAKDAAGVQIPNSYLVGVDIGNVDCCFKNWDYQDYLFLMTNVTPETAPPTPGAAIGSGAVNRDFSAPVAGTVADVAGNGTGFASVQPNTAGNQYDASKITLDTANGHLILRSGAGTNSLGTNNQLNALQTNFNASTGKFRVQSRFVGPFNFLDVNNEQQAIYFGPDQNNHLKAEIEYANGAVVLTIWLEQNGSGQIIQRTVVPGLVNASSVDFRIDVDPNFDKTANVFYAVNGGAFTKLNNNAIGIPGWWMGVTVPAGILVSHQGGSEFSARFDNFGVVGW